MRLIELERDGDREKCLKWREPLRPGVWTESIRLYKSCDLCAVSYTGGNIQGA